MRFLLLILLPIFVIGQNENLNSGKYSLANRIFETKCEKNNYIKIPNSQIKVEKNRIIFNNVSTLEFDDNIDSNAKIVLANGFLNPYEINKSFSLRILLSKNYHY